MERVVVTGGELDAEARGSGEPVLLIHGAITPHTWAPLLHQTVLSEGYRLIHYHRRGFAGSTHVEPLQHEVEDALAVLRHFGVDKAHVVGHSGGAFVALRLALESPDKAHSLVLAEPPAPVMGGRLPSPAPATAAQASAPDNAPSVADRISTALEALIGRDGRLAFDRELPAGWFEQAVTDARFAPGPGAAPPIDHELARRTITQPVLAVVGEMTTAFSHEGHDLLLKMLPQAEEFVLPGATHAMQVMNPAGMAHALAGFFARYPLPATATGG